jgi:hypothetical protein
MLPHHIVRVPDWKPVPDESAADVRWVRVIAGKGTGSVPASIKKAENGCSAG